MDKKRIVFKNGLSFQQFENEFRAKYKHIKIPEIKLVNRSQFDMSYRSSENIIIVSDRCLSKENSLSLEWCMLHEIGHAQYPNLNSSIIITSLLSACLTPFVWGKHKIKPYRNIFTNVASKGLVTITLPVLFFCMMRKFDERMADNFANKHADKEALFEGVNYFELFKQEELKALEEIKIYSPAVSKILKIKVLKILGSPIHPTLDSRIAKIKGALKTRFGVDA